MAKSTIATLFGLIICPITTDRKRIATHFEQLLELMEYLKQSKVAEGSESLCLSGYLDPQRCLDWENRQKCISHLLLRKSFFSRFTSEQLHKCLKEATVESYSAGSIVFLKNRVGIVYSGALDIRQH